MQTRPLRAKVLDTLSSLKLSISLFVALAVTSIFGTLIQQQADPRAYVASYGPALAKVFQALNLVDMYHSWWFELLLALLLANTLVCSLRRLPAALRSLRPEQFPTAEDMAKKQLRASWRAGEGTEAAVEETLRQSFGRSRIERSEGGATWFAQKQPWARLGPYVAHTSLVLFFLGGIVGARFGFKGFVNIVEGQAASAIELRGGQPLKLPFEVACEKFELHNYPDGRPKDYLSRLVVRKGGQVVQEKTVEVNHPLIQDGVFFYQSSYGKAGGGALLRVFDREGRVLADGIRLAEEQAAPIPGTDLHVEVMTTSENYNGFGPAAQLTLVGPNHEHRGQPFSVFKDFPKFDERRRGEQVFQLVGLLPGKWYTGLQVAKDPGVPLIWAGSIVLTLGTLMAFFASHRRVWVRLEEGRLTVAGSASKNLSAFQEAFSELERELRERTENAKRKLQAVG